MDTPDKAVNAGVHASTGFEFQKHCALYILLENYADLQNSRYFICIEHHDDILFCFQDPNDSISNIDAYQAKKSSDKWKNSGLYDIIKHIIHTGHSLANDPIEKLSTYSHTLSFLTNNSIHVTSGTKKGSVSEIINEANLKVKYTDLHDDIKKVVKDELTKICDPKKPVLDQLDHMSLVYIDLPKASKSQIHQLIGKFQDTFGDQVEDHKAAIMTLIDLFRDIENTFNQGGKSDLMHKSKRLESQKINDAINVITTQQLAYSLWKSKKDEINTILSIPVAQRRQFKLEFENSFDYFKDLTQAEHRKILKFTKEDCQIILDTCITDEDCVHEIYSKYKLNNNSQLSDLQLKAALFAAYVQTKGNI